MHRMEKACDIGVPVRVAYDQWTQFEEFPRFMDGVKEVKQLDDTHLHWRASVAGRDKEWDAEITEQVPDQVIAWRSTSGAPNAGEVRFEKLDDGHTRVRVAMMYEPEGAMEKAGDAMGFLSRQVDKTVNDFKDFVERRRRETGAWRGEVRGGMKKPEEGERGTGRGDGLGGRGAAGNPGTLGAAPGAAGGTYPGGTGGTPGAGGGVPGSTPGPGNTPGGSR